jgi:hypothetical protein
VGRHVSAVLHHRFGIPTQRFRKAARGKNVGPTRGFATSLEVGPGATVGTLRTGYPRVQALSQGNGSRLPAKGSSEAVRCPCGSGSRSRLGAAPGPPRAPAARDSTGATTCPSGSRQLRGRHVSLGLQHSPSGAGQLRSCHCHVSPGLQHSPNHHDLHRGGCTRIFQGAT